MQSARAGLHDSEKTRLLMTEGTLIKEDPHLELSSTKVHTLLVKEFSFGESKG